MEANDPQRTTTALSFAAYTAMRQGNTRKATALREAARRDTSVHPGLRTYVTYQAAEILAGDDRAAAYRLLSEAERMVTMLKLSELTEHLVVQVMADSLASLPDEWRTSEWAERRRAFLAA